MKSLSTLLNYFNGLLRVVFALSLLSIMRKIWKADRKFNSVNSHRVFKGSPLEIAGMKTVQFNFFLNCIMKIVIVVIKSMN